VLAANCVEAEFRHPGQPGHHARTCILNRQGTTAAAHPHACFSKGCSSTASRAPLQRLWGSKAHAQAHTHVRAHTHTHTHAHAHAHTHTNINTRANTHRCAHTHTHTRARIHVRTHTHTHAHMHMRAHVRFCCLCFAQGWVMRSSETFNTLKYALNTQYAYNTVPYFMQFRDAGF